MRTITDYRADGTQVVTTFDSDTQTVTVADDGVVSTRETTADETAFEDTGPPSSVVYRPTGQRLVRALRDHRDACRAAIANLPAPADRTVGQRRDALLLRGQILFAKATLTSWGGLGET